MTPTGRQQVEHSGSPLVISDKSQQVTASLSGSVVESELELVETETADEFWTRYDVLDDVLSDHQNYYTENDFRLAAMGLGISASFAHTDVDECFRNWWQDDVRSDAWDNFSHFAKPLGDGYVSLAIIGTGLVGGAIAGDYHWGAVSNEWGRRSLRALAVGAPPLLFVQAATGAGRPGENSAESDWIPFQDTNGASGHAFMAAVPFIVAAQMTEDRLLSGIFYTGSTMCAVSRINDDDHYLSQVILGWCLAKMACDAVNRTETENAYELVPLTGEGGMAGIGIEFRR